MILLNGWIYEGVSTETKPSTLTGARSGQIFKELDTGESYQFFNDVWQFINLGLSFIKATKSGRITTDGTGVYNVSFVTPFINSLYTVALSTQDDGTNHPSIASFSNISNGGFRITTRYSRTGNLRPNTVVSWLATRDYNP